MRYSAGFPHPTSLLRTLTDCVAHTFFAVVATLLAGAAEAQVTADLHTSAHPRVILPAEGERRILPDGRSIRLKVGPASTGSGYLFLGDEELPPGSRVPRHRHELDEEVLIVLAGEVTFLLNDSAHLAPAGSVVYLPPRNWIAVENRGSTPARVMFAFPRGAVERCFQFIGRSEADSAAGRSPMRGATEMAEERHSCQMTYRAP